MHSVLSILLERSTENMTEYKVFTQDGMKSTRHSIIKRGLWRIKSELSLEDCEWVRKNRKMVQRQTGTLVWGGKAVAFWGLQTDINITES